jgi:hypothetical protein
VKTNNFSEKQQKPYYMPMSRIAGVGLIAGSKKVDEGEAKALANALATPATYNKIQISFEKAIRARDDSFRAFSDSKLDVACKVKAENRIQYTSNKSRSPKVVWNTYKLFLERKGHEQWFEITTRFLIVVCRDVYGSKLWTSCRLLNLCEKVDNSFKPIDRFMDIEAVKDYFKLVRPFSENVCKGIWKLYKKQVKETIERDTSHSAWIAAEGANTIESLANYPKLYIDAQKRPIESVIKETPGFKRFLNDFYIPVSEIYSSHGTKKDILEFGKKREPWVDSGVGRVGYMLVAPTVENVYQSCDINNSKVDGYRLIGLSSCSNPFTIEPGRDMNSNISRDATWVVSHCF